MEKCDFDLSGQYLASMVSSEEVFITPPSGLWREDLSPILSICPVMQGGSRNTVWDFSNDGPTGRAPICTAGHTQRINCQVADRLLSSASPSPPGPALPGLTGSWD